jgi:hypothetical protein
MRRFAVLAALPFLVNGCAGLAFQNRGVPQGLPSAMTVGLPIPSVIYVDAAQPLQATGNSLGKKKGEACATSILGWVTTGDASIRAAADAAGITAIGAVDNNYTNILGVYAKFCTMVSEGVAGASPAPEPAPEAVPAPAEPAPEATPEPAKEPAKE